MEEIAYQGIPRWPYSLDNVSPTRSHLCWVRNSECQYHQHSDSSHPEYVIPVSASTILQRHKLPRLSQLALYTLGNILPVLSQNFRDR